MINYNEINKELLDGSWINQDNLGNIKDSIPTFFGYYPKSQFDSNRTEREVEQKNRTEREVEQNSDVCKLKEGRIIQPLVNDIIMNIKTNFNINKIDYITFTPDSGNTENNINMELTGFSLVCEYISNELGISIILPKVVKQMKKQKTMSFSERINNRRGAYSFNINDVNGKTILFLDDVVTTCATMCSIGEDIVNKGGYFIGYGIANSELDSYNK